MEENKMSVELLTQAVKEKDTEIAKLLIKRGVDVNALVTDSDADEDPHYRIDKNPLHWAAYKGHKDVAELLIEAGADVNATVTRYDEDDPYNGCTSLHYAAYYGHKNVAKYS